MKKYIFFLLAIVILPCPSYMMAQDSTFVKPDRIAIFSQDGKGEYAFIRDNLVYPKKALENGIEGTSFIGYTIGTDGQIRDVHIQLSSNPILDKEALRVVKLMKQWQPAMKDGKPVEFKCVTPIKFSINDARIKAKAYEKAREREKESAPIAPVTDRGANFTYKGQDMNAFISSNLTYPQEAYFKGIEGVSYIGVTIGADGKMRDAHIWKPTNAILDKAALKVVKKMKKWEPAIKDGQPVESKRVITIPFSLRNTKVIYRYQTR